MNHLKAFQLILASVGIHWLKVTDILFFWNTRHFFLEFQVQYFSMNEGLVVSTCLAGAFAGSLISGWIADGVGRRRAFQLCSLPMIMGASLW